MLRRLVKTPIYSCSPVRAVSDGHSQYEKCEVSKIQNEILSVKTVLEMKIEEVRGLRKELERRRWWRDGKGTQTGEDKEEHGSSAGEVFISNKSFSLLPFCLVTDN